MSQFLSLSPLIKFGNESISIYPVPFESYFLHVSLNSSITDSDTFKFSASDVSPKPSRIIAINKFRKMKVTMRRKLIKKKTEESVPQPSGFPSLAYICS
jgi:hypothetical protein